MSEQETATDITRYKIISKVGEGSFSNVYRVKDLKTNNYYAAKVSKIMIDEDTKDSSEVLSLFREVNLMSLLDHPCVLTFVGYYPTNFEEEPLPTIITEFSMNGSLRDIIRLEAQGLSPDKWTFTKKLINIYGIASGMSYLHSHNILHRDLKPENVLLNDYLQPKISDFGLSKINDFISMSMNIQSQKGLKGTPIYMSPEILSNEIYSKSSDVYAFAFVVYEIVTCNEPFRNIHILHLMHKIVNEGSRPEISQEVPSAYRELIERCWLQKAEERPTFEEIVEELKTNNEFITDVVDESEYYDYVDYIDSCQSTFDISKKRIHFSDFIQNQGRNKNVKPMLFNKTLFKDDSNNDDDEQTYESKHSSKNETEVKHKHIIYKEESTKNTSSTNNNDIKSMITEQQKIDENEINSNKIVEDEQIKAYNLKYPIHEFIQLSKKNQALVEEAETKIDKQFEIGKFLIDGQNDFPMNINLGLQYIKQSVRGQNNEALIYYIEILIKGKIIEENLNIADEYLSKLNQTCEQDKYYLQGLMKYKQNKFKESSRIFEEGIRKGSLKCMYKYGKMIFIGEIAEKNNNEYIQYFNRSAEQGYKKSEYFLTSFNELKKIKDFLKLPLETQLILITNNIKNLINKSSTQFSQFLLHPKKTEKLFFNKSLKSPIFYVILKRYENISIEIDYESSSFEQIIDLIIKIRKNKLKNLAIGIVFASFSEPIYENYFSKYITYFRIETFIQTIPNKVFVECSLLKQIIIPSSVIDIGSDAFLDCSKLKQITLPFSLIKIGDYAFNGCSSLQQITIPFSVNTIGKGAFYGCSSLAHIAISSSITEIANCTFFECSSLKQITIPSSVTKIGSDSFYGCSSLTQITIPSSVIDIGTEAFFGCASLNQIAIPSSVNKIGSFAFSGCSSLKQITIPSSVNEIGSFAFNGCSSLKQITIPSFVNKIGEGVLNECIKLNDIKYLPSNENKFQYYQKTFFLCKSDITSNIYDSLISITSNSETINLPPFIKIIFPNMFSKCTSLKQIILPSSMTEIGDYAFNDCVSLKQIAIPSSIIEIKSYAFSGCLSLTQITIPPSVTKIGSDAFSFCSSLKQIAIPSSVTEIGSNAFYECSSLKQITIPSTFNPKIIGLYSKVKIKKI